MQGGFAREVEQDTDAAVHKKGTTEVVTIAQHFVVGGT